MSESESEIEVVNSTYYNTDDLRKIINAVVLHTVKKVLVKYAGKMTEYHEDSYSRSYGGPEGHRWSLQGKGWGEILSLGEYPRASASRGKGRHGLYQEITLSIVRKTRIYGDNDLEVLASGTLSEVPEAAVKHIAFALTTEVDRLYDWEDTWGGCPRTLRIEEESKKSGRLATKLSKAEKALREAKSSKDDANYRLSSHKRSVEYWTGRVKEAGVLEEGAQEAVDKLRGEIAGAKAKEITARIGKAGLVEEV